MKTKVCKVILMFVLVIGFGLCWLNGEGQEKQEKFTPDPIKGKYPPRTRGDGEFFGNGPHVLAKAELYIKENEIWVKLSLTETETRSDWTTFDGTWDEKIWTAPDGNTIKEILSPQSLSSTAEYTDTNDDLDVPTVKPPDGPVRSFEIMGDQFGQDHPFMNVYFNEISVKIKQGN